MAQEISLLNSSIGPIMRGPSSSHSAAPYMIGRTVRELSLTEGDELTSVEVCFDPTGSFSQVYSNQGSDEGFAAGVSGLELSSDKYSQVLELLEDSNEFSFSIIIRKLGRNEHPNRVDLILNILQADGVERTDYYEAVSTGGGMFDISLLNEQEIKVNGKCAGLLIEHNSKDPSTLITAITQICPGILEVYKGDRIIQLNLSANLKMETATAINGLPEVIRIRSTLARQEPALSDKVLFRDVTSVINDLKGSETLAQLALKYEAERLQVQTDKVQSLFQKRLKDMLNSISKGFAAGPERRSMRFLQPSAQRFRDTALPEGMNRGFLKDAIAGALAVMEEGTCRGVVCAAPTAGSAGIVPGTLYGLQQGGTEEPLLIEALQVMALIGAVFAARGSFAAETGGCSVETGTSAAMASAGIVFCYGGSAEQIFDAASLCLMNTLGLVCDPVGGEVEIPCHARNIAGVSHAWSASMAVMGGFTAVLPFDELVDKTVEIGKQMNADLRCTARGGCATTPTAKHLVKNLIHPS